MADHLFDELDRDEVDLFNDADGLSIREKLQNWLGTAPSAFQISVAEDKHAQMVEVAAAVGLRISTSVVREGLRNVERTVLRDARGRFVARGGTRVRQFLEDEISF